MAPSVLPWSLRSSCSSSATRGRSLRRAARRAVRRTGRRLVNEADQEQVLAFASNRLYVDAEREYVAIVLDLAAGDQNARVFLAGALDRRPELGPHVVTRHGEHILAWRAASRAITVCRAEGIQALVLPVDQQRRRRVAFGHQPYDKDRRAQPGAKRPVPVLVCETGRTPSPPAIEKSTSPGRLRPIWR